MLGKSLINSSLGSPSEAPIFIYEVTGLKQNKKKDNNRYPYRKL
jgi:hypothetical protein